MHAHNVYFALNDQAQEKIDALVAGCKKYLSGTPGIESFAVGVLDAELKRPVNDTGFQVSLHMMFVDRSAHDEYQTSATHQEFIRVHQANWDFVRVFDSTISE